MLKKSPKLVSVFIPTYNGQQYIAECIKMLLRQDLPSGCKLEILITDSGSIDGTLQALEPYSEHINLLKIPNSQFGHGKTRQEAALRAQGEFILFLSQDATPAHERWLISMIEPFYISPDVGCVFGAQVPRADAPPTIKREVSGTFASLGARDAIILHRAQSLVDQTNTNALNSFFSDVNSAIRRDLLVGKVPFRDVNYAEDQALAEDMQKAGYLKAYAPQAEVRHSNEYTAHEYFKRKLDEYIGLQESLGFVLPRSRKSLLLGWIRPTLADYKFTRADREYGWRLKLKGFWLAPQYNIALQAGKYSASKYLDNPAVRKKLSLEKNLRKDD